MAENQDELEEIRVLTDQLHQLTLRTKELKVKSIGVNNATDKKKVLAIINEAKTILQESTDKTNKLRVKLKDVMGTQGTPSNMADLDEEIRRRLKEMGVSF